MKNSRGGQHWFAHNYYFSNCFFPENSSLQYCSEVKLKYDPCSAFDGLGDLSEGAIPLTMRRRWIVAWIFFFFHESVFVFAKHEDAIFLVRRLKM